MKQFLIIALLATGIGKAQAQPYYFTESVSTYANLTGETVLTTAAPWTYASSFTVPIGFTFNFMGTNFTTVYVEGSGFTYFDFNYYYLALPFTVKLQSKGPSGNNSPISYKVDGVAPNRICKVQWKNAGFYYDTTSTINFQMWLYETSNKMEVHFGTSNVPNPSVVYQENGSDGPVIGVYEYSGANCLYSLCLTGQPSQLSLVNQTGTFNLFATSVDGTPPANTVYTFDPNPTGIPENVSMPLTVFPNPGTDVITIQSPDAIQACVIYSASGQLISRRNVVNNQVDVSDLPSGMYLLETTVSGAISRSRLVISR